MPLKIRRSRQAQLDQTEIWLTIAEDSVRAADGVIERFNEAILMLAEHPEAGRARNDLGEDLRYFPIGSYLIFYSASSETLGIRRLLHGARDITAALFDLD